MYDGMIEGFVTVLEKNVRGVGNYLLKCFP